MNIQFKRKVSKWEEKISVKIFLLKMKKTLDKHHEMIYNIKVA